MSGTVVNLNKHIPAEVRDAAKRAYAARKRHRESLIEVGSANRAFAQACKRFNLNPELIQVGELCGMSFVPASTVEP